jgi:predicted ester cyclase
MERGDGLMAVTKELAWELAKDWIAAWNAHDLEWILTHYEDEVELTSPVAARLLGAVDGKVVGKAALGAYFKRGLEAYPELRFELKDVFVGLNSVVLLYANQNGTHTAEHMELSTAGKVVRVVANYGS